MLSQVATAELILTWILWLAVFIRRHLRPAGPPAVVIAPRARWGMLLEGLAYALAWGFPQIAWDSSFRARGFRPAPFLAASMLLGPAAVALAWYAVRHLGKQWRIQAGLSADHELVQTGPYRFLRHPVYASMLLLLVATMFAWTWWPVWPPALALFFAGTEVRVRAEDRLLAGRFKREFAEYKAHVRAYIPFVR